MSHLPLDARAILMHLNDLGYRNISSEQLREFLKDLRRLIKYEEHMATLPRGDYFSILHKRDTISSRAKQDEKEKENMPPQVNSEKAKQPPMADKNKETRCAGGSVTGTGTDVAPTLNLAAMFREKLLIDKPKEPPKTVQPVRRSRSRSRSRSNTLKPISSKESKASKTYNVQDARNSNIRRARPRSSSRHSINGNNQDRKYGLKPPRTDPVALYHYYQNEWSHFRHQIPGENSHTELRTGIRNRFEHK